MHRVHRDPGCLPGSCRFCEGYDTENGRAEGAPYLGELFDGELGPDEDVASLVTW